ncbi:protein MICRORCHIDIA 4-like [Tasmannia lanceolata]|uniref:protein MICRORCHIDIA 4-like n=1 Tax=Tasmannia lanceolata TaxID=3420 RepID=UPI004063E304
MLENKKDKNKMLLIEDNGGGMDPDKMRKCMSLGYSAKSKIANTIGQYGNGFKTSTMRLGADVIVFSRCRGKDGKSSTQSIGLLSYTFLRSTGKEDIVVPMLDYVKEGKAWNKLIRSSPIDWNRNVETVVQWSPYSSEADLLQQFNSLEAQGTRIIIYNLWEDDQGQMELDFGADQNDIQIRGVNRDAKKIQMAKQFPNSRHFLTYQHSLRSYASILYLRLPHGFRMILLGKDIEHHNIVHDMMLNQEITYRPQPNGDGVPKDPNMVAVVTIGFVKDAEDHIDIQGFNVYHKNRLIKPFWRIWNAAGSDGRGVIGVLEANFVEPAHDKQGFERTTVLARLEARLVQIQKTYWRTNCHKIGYAPRHPKKLINQSSIKETSPEVPETLSSNLRNFTSTSCVTPLASRSQDTTHTPLVGRDLLGVGSSKIGDVKHVSGHVSTGAENGKTVSKFGKEKSCSPQSMLHASSSEDDESGHENHCCPLERQAANSTYNGSGSSLGNSDPYALKRLEEENLELNERLQKSAESMVMAVDCERDRNKSLNAIVHDLERKIEEANKEQEALIDIFSEERNRRDEEEENLRKRLKGAYATIQELQEKLRFSCNSVKPER